MPERLQKVMAAAGVASRRACERMIEEGRVKVNGQVAGIGTKVDEKDRVTIDDKPIAKQAARQSHKVIAYNKPDGEITTRNDPEGRPSVFAALPKVRSGRWISIGRLDINTGGLLLFTTDGELAHRLMHPSYTVERKYAVRVLGEVTDAVIRKLKKGVELEDGMARFLSIADAGGTGSNHWYHVSLAEGRNREVRRLWEAVGLKVSRLMRIAYAGIALPAYLRTGHHKELTANELKTIYNLVNLEPPNQPLKTEKTQEKDLTQRSQRKTIQKSKEKIRPRNDHRDVGDQSFPEGIRVESAFTLKHRKTRKDTEKAQEKDLTQSLRRPQRGTIQKSKAKTRPRKDTEKTQERDLTRTTPGMEEVERRNSDKTLLLSRVHSAGPRSRVYALGRPESRPRRTQSGATQKTETPARNPREKRLPRGTLSKSKK